MLSAPLLVGAALVSLVVSLVQTLTSVQEQTLTAVPRLVVVFTLAMVTMPWTAHRLVNFTVHLWTGLSPVPGIGASVSADLASAWTGPAIRDWPAYLSGRRSGDGAVERVDGLWADLFNSSAIAPPIKAGLVIADDDPADAGGGNDAGRESCARCEWAAGRAGRGAALRAVADAAERGAGVCRETCWDASSAFRW